MFVGANVLTVRGSLYHTTSSDTIAAFTTRPANINAATTTFTTTTTTDNDYDNNNNNISVGRIAQSV